MPSMEIYLLFYWLGTVLILQIPIKRQLVTIWLTKYSRSNPTVKIIAYCQNSDDYQKMYIGKDIWNGWLTARGPVPFLGIDDLNPSEVFNLSKLSFTILFDNFKSTSDQYKKS